MERNAEPAELLRSLGESLARVEAVGSRLTAERLVAPPAPGAWSPNEVLWHIRASADVYDEHVRRILDEDAPTWRHVSPRARMKKSRYDLLPFAESAEAFARQRTELIALLGSIAAQSWRRFALVRVEKREWRLTLHERVWGLANHEEVHGAQLEDAATALLAGRA
jgi:hypothetical protein